jgi:hypothetical protein
MKVLRVINSDMGLNNTTRERLEDIQDLEPTSNSELKDRWEMDSGKDVAAYIREELGEYTYRDDDSRIRTVDGKVGGETEADSSQSISGSGSDVQRNVSGSASGNEGDTSSERNAPQRETAEHDDAVTMTQEEFDQAIEAAREAGYEDGYHDGYETAKAEFSGGTGGQSSTEDLRCHACGGELYDFRDYPTGQYHRVNGEKVYINGDYQCSSCSKWWVDERSATA